MTRQAHASARPNFAFKPTVAALAVATCFLQPALVIANPTGAQVAAGSAQFATNGNTLTVTNAPNTIINWQQFNIGAGETTRFQQQSANSAILNRVVGNNPSQIYGTLSSNGQVFLINQNGILVGPNAIIDVNRLVLSTLNLTDANFLNKNFSFTGGGYGQLVNQGKITTPLGGSVYLVGSDVRNEGIITSPQGQVVLAAGNTVSMTDTAGPELTVTVSANGNKAVNLGTVTAAGGQINMFGALIEQQGVLSADSASIDAQGRIILKASDSTTVSGTLSATNSVGKGGDIQVLGNNVTLTGTASLDASGATGGGNVLVGGDWQGNNAKIPNAQNTTMQAGATIKADATQNGDGGKVVLWADNTTDFKGSIFARGGMLGGNGGQVETSGKQNLLLGGTVNTLAPLGKKGFWLLDPQAYCIDNTGTFCSGYIAATVITTSNLATMLNSSDVTLQATDYIVLGDVTLNSYGFTRSGANLSLVAPSVQQLMNFSSGSKLNLSIKAAGTSATYASKSGQADVIGSSIYTYGGNLIIEAEKRIVADGSSSTVLLSTEPSPNPNPYNWLSSGVLVLSAPDVIALGTVQMMNRGNNTAFIANKIGGSGILQGDLNGLDIQTYTPGFNIYIARPNSDPACGTSGLCISNQFANITGRELYFVSGRCAIQNIISDTCGFNTVSLDGDIFIGGFGSSWSAPNIPRDYLAFIGKNITLAQPIGRNGANSQRPDQHVLGFIATEKFTNLVGTNPFPNLVAGKLWSITVGDYAGSNFGGLESLAQRIDLATWSAREIYDDGGTNNWNNSLFPRTSNAIFVIGAGSIKPIIDPCLQNPASCNSSAINPSGTHSTQGYTPALNGPLTIAAELTADERYIARGDKAGDDRTIAAKLTQSDKKTAKRDEDKTAEEVRAEAKAAKEDASKADKEAKLAEAEAKAAEAEVKAAKTPQQRAAAQRRAEAKRAEADVQRARADAKRAEAGSREALADSKQAAGATQAGTAGRGAGATAATRTADTNKNTSRQADAEARKAEAESKLATAESKQADLRAKQADADAKQAEADVRAAKTPEQKLAATQRAEVKKTEAQAHKAESDARKTEAEGKRIEAQAKKAEIDARKAESEAKEARSPQQKAKAEQRAEAKKNEAEVKKAEASAKQGEADAKLAKAEAKHAEADAKAARSPGGRAVHEKRAEAKKAEGDAKEAQAQVKKAEADEKRARAEEKQARAEARAEKNAQKKAAAEQKAEQKKAEADKKQAEAQAKKAEAEAKQAAAEKKAEEHKAAEAKRSEERRVESAKAFGKIAAATTSREGLTAVVSLRHELKSEALQPALSVLERNPNAASLPPCSSGTSVLCIPDGTPLVSTLPEVKTPSLSFLPQIERKRALVIGINSYSDNAIPSLETALPDAQAIGKQLKEQMGYDVTEVPNASRADIITSLNRLAREVGPNDSVTVYYAGHGYLSEKTGQGYWIPGDAKVTTPENWITNNDIAKLLGNIPARQVLLVSDSCYSGSLTKQQWTGASQKLDPQRILTKRSVTVLSSGGEEPVSDEGKDGHSIFAYSFMKSLRSVDKVESAGQLFESVKAEVIREFPQTPAYGGSVSAGHDTGADYLFEKRSFK